MVLKANMPHILVVDDDDRIRKLLAQYLSKNGYIAITARDAAEARSILKKYQFDICVLDVMMPGENGIDLAKYIGLSFELPILMLTAMGESQDRIKGLEAGVDDYLVKPFEPKELLLRIQAILKRSQSMGAVQSSHHQIFRLHNRIYNSGEETMQTDEGRFITLTDGDKAILKSLSQKPNMPIRREMLATQLDMDSNDRAVDVAITRLRKKIEPDPTNPSIVVTLRGKGYMLKVVEND